jgi:hypothetical protein
VATTRHLFDLLRRVEELEERVTRLEKVASRRTTKKTAEPAGE